MCQTNAGAKEVLEYAPGEYTMSRLAAIFDKEVLAKDKKVKLYLLS